jgi:ATP-dependent RNA helicase SUPV3L1/SUV3
MAHHVGVFDGTTKNELLIKTFRRLWSEERDDFRELIVDFFIHDGKRYPNPKPREKPHEREEKIDEMLEAFEISDAERRDLHAAFIDIRTRKITPEKNRLQTRTHPLYPQTRTSRKSAGGEI